MPLNTIPPELLSEDQFSNLDGFCEATHFEYQCLCLKTSLPYNWTNAGDGFLLTLGTFHGRPVCVSFLFKYVEGKKICFWHATSALVDHNMIDKWFRLHFHGIKKTDAQNFHNILR